MSTVLETIAGPRAGLPTPRGDLSAALLAALSARPGAAIAEPSLPEDVLGDDDLHLALRCCYELHHGGFANADQGWEWDRPLLAWRKRLEDAFEAALRDATGPVRRPLDLVGELRRLSAPSAVSLTGWLEEHGEPRHAREMAVHRSVDELIIDLDDLSVSRPWTDAMEVLRLDPRPCAYLDRIPGSTLAVANLASLVGIHRRLRGAVRGHLAVRDLLDRPRDRRYAAWLERTGLGVLVPGVVGRAGNERPSPESLAGGILAHQPDLAADAARGAAAARILDTRMTREILSCWQAGGSSLYGDDPLD